MLRGLLCMPMKSFAVLCLSLVTGFACNKGEVVETIGGHSIYAQEYLDYYDTSVNLASRMVGADKKFVSRMICDESSSLSKALKPSNHYARYRDSLMVARVAEEEGFLDNPSVQRMLEQSRLQTIGQLYINAKLLEKIEIPESAKLEVCKKLRKEKPKQMASLSLEDCTALAEGVLKRRLMSERTDVVINEIKESIAIKRNLEFDQRNFLRNLPLYQDLKEQGGCLEEGEKTSQKESKKKKASGKKGK